MCVFTQSYTHSLLHAPLFHCTPSPVVDCTDVEDHARPQVSRTFSNTGETRPRTGNKKTSLPACSTTTDAYTMPLAIQLSLARHAATVIGVVK
ncbi:hypothetical protein ALC60_01470 [Trachymyrmex zeteki]|uniref:Uncharacterized protein n=1 Tax=Mycetomoellerius zeteki TaxID=64791 RepID=A0A151XGP1_9HYME|nr:hypothetical protein ALC60_01470 [Trachymyrmex zeteki]